MRNEKERKEEKRSERYSSLSTQEAYLRTLERALLRSLGVLGADMVTAYSTSVYIIERGRINAPVTKERCDAGG